MSPDAFAELVAGSCNGALQLAFERPHNNLNKDLVAGIVNEAKQQIMDLGVAYALGKISEEDRDNETIVVEKALQKIIPILEDRAQHSAIFVIPKEKIQLRGDEREDYMSKINYDMLVQSGSRQPIEFHFENCSITPSSFSHVLIPEQYRSSTSKLSRLMQQLPCRLIHVPNSKFEELEWNNQVVPGNYPDYMAGLLDMLNDFSSDNPIAIAVIVHATRSKTRAESAIAAAPAVAAAAAATKKTIEKAEALVKEMASVAAAVAIARKAVDEAKKGMTPLGANAIQERLKEAERAAKASAEAAAGAAAIGRELPSRGTIAGEIYWAVANDMVKVSRHTPWTLSLRQEEGRWIHDPDHGPILLRIDPERLGSLEGITVALGSQESPRGIQEKLLESIPDQIAIQKLFLRGKERLDD